MKKILFLLAFLCCVGLSHGQDNIYFKAARQNAVSIDVTNLEAYYDFEQNGNDIQGNHNATPTNVVYNASGKIGYSFDPDGDSDYFTIADHNNLSFTGGQAFSLDVWAKFDNLDGNIMVSKRSGAGHEYQFAVNSSGDVEFFIWDGDAADYLNVTAAWSPSLDTWYHLVATHDGTETNAGMKIYIDKVLQSTTNNNGGTFTAMINTGAPVYIGIYGPIPTNPAAWDGEGDLLKIWREELTQSKIDAIYDKENGGTLITN